MILRSCLKQEDFVRRSEHNFPRSQQPIVDRILEQNTLFRKIHRILQSE